MDTTINYEAVQPLANYKAGQVIVSGKFLKLSRDERMRILFASKILRSAKLNGLGVK